MRIIRCEECGREVQAREAEITWWSVNRSPSFSVYGETEPGERHFCSHACIGAFYTKLDEQGGDRKLAEHVRPR